MKARYLKFVLMTFASLLAVACGNSGNNNNPTCGAGYMPVNGQCVVNANYAYGNGAYGAMNCQGSCPVGQVQTAQYGCQPQATTAQCSNAATTCVAWANNTCTPGLYQGYGNNGQYGYPNSGYYNGGYTGGYTGGYGSGYGYPYSGGYYGGGYGYPYGGYGYGYPYGGGYYGGGYFGGTYGSGCYNGICH